MPRKHFTNKIINSTTHTQIQFSLFSSSHLPWPDPQISLPSPLSSSLSLSLSLSKPTNPSLSLLQNHLSLTDPIHKPRNSPPQNPFPQNHTRSILPLEVIDHIHGSHGLPPGVLSVCLRATNHGLPRR